jgi:5-(carboxyamino)imidazole ribonucleotide mutase
MGVARRAKRRGATLINGEEPRLTNRPVVSIVMGSESDLEVMREAAKILGRFGIAHEVRVLSAHRSPNLVTAYVRKAEREGVKVFIAGAGAAAALPGAVAALTIRPVLGVPLATSHLQGLDALLAIAQLPAGTPAGALAIGIPGARNAAHLAVEILGVSDAKLAGRYRAFKVEQERAIGRTDAKVRKTG